MKDNNKLLYEIDEALPEPSFADLYSFLTERGYAKLIVRWRKDISKNEQIMQLRKLCSDLKKYSIGELFTRAKEKEDEWELITMGYGEAVDVAEKAKELGLKIEVQRLQKINDDIE